MDTLEGLPPATDERQEMILSASDRQFRLWVDREFRKGEAQFKLVLEQLAHNTVMSSEAVKISKSNAKATAELVSIFKAAKTGVSWFRVSGVTLRKAAVFVTPFLVLFGIIAALLHGDYKDFLKFWK